MADKCKICLKGWEKETPVQRSVYPPVPKKPRIIGNADCQKLFLQEEWENLFVEAGIVLRRHETSRATSFLRHEIRHCHLPHLTFQMLKEIGGSIPVGHILDIQAYVRKLQSQ